MTERPHLRLEHDGVVARVILDRPEVHNAFDDALIASLTAAAGEIAADPGVRVVVLSGAGPTFCAGADVRWMQRTVDFTEEENRRDAEALALMYEAWDGLEKPVIARVHGAALGGGVGLIAVCDIVVAADDAAFAFSEVRLGILPAVISPFVLRKIGVGAARDLFLTGERFTAERALRIGLVQRSVPPQVLDAEIERVVGALLAGGPSAQVRAKKLIGEIAGHPPSKSRALTTEAIARARAGAEGQDGLRAFLERRKPSWRSGE